MSKIDIEQGLRSTAYLSAADILYRFDVNPNSVEWNYRHHTHVQDTLGGRVVQLLGVSVEGMTIRGDAGAGIDGRKKLQKLASRIGYIMQTIHVERQNPVYFKVPSRDWKFRVYITSAPRLGWDSQTLTYPYELQFQVIEDLGIATRDSLHGELDRLKRGIGYDPKWHGGNAAEGLAVVQDMYGGGGGGSDSKYEHSGGTVQSHKEIKRRLQDGYRKVGRGDMADIVMSDDFHLWISQESGWNPENVSLPNNNGRVNGGLFQFWYGDGNRDWVEPFFSMGGTKSYDQGNRFTMSIEDQAKASVQHFDLTVSDIRTYGTQIRGGYYEGWG